MKTPRSWWRSVVYARVKTLEAANMQNSHMLVILRKDITQMDLEIAELNQRISKLVEDIKEISVLINSSNRGA